MFTTTKLDSWKAGRVEFTIIQTEFHRRVEAVTARGLVYANTWAATPDAAPLTRETVERCWQENRREFLPFNQSTGCYV